MEIITAAAKVIYTAKTKVTGGRDNGVAKSSDGRLDIRLTRPGKDGDGTNPEQLFAAGWSACFEEAIGIAASKGNIIITKDPIINTEVDLCIDKGQYQLQARMYIILPETKKETAETLIEAARKICPYTKAIERNINVEFHIV
jgi:lipoyl-dependent peroxiredoxin